MNKNGELSDEELDNVSGGCGPYQSGDTPTFNVGDRVIYQIIKSWAYVGGCSIPRYEERQSTVVSFTKENEVFRYRLTNGDGVPEYELEGM